MISRSASTVTATSDTRGYTCPTSNENLIALQASFDSYVSLPVAEETTRQSAGLAAACECARARRRISFASVEHDHIGMLLRSGYCTNSSYSQVGIQCLVNTYSHRRFQLTVYIPQPPWSDISIVNVNPMHFCICYPNQFPHVAGLYAHQTHKLSTISKYSIYQLYPFDLRKHENSDIFPINKLQIFNIEPVLND